MNEYNDVTFTTNSKLNVFDENISNAQVEYENSLIKQEENFLLKLKKKFTQIKKNKPLRQSSIMHGAPSTPKAKTSQKDANKKNSKFNFRKSLDYTPTLNKGLMRSSTLKPLVASLANNTPLSASPKKSKKKISRRFYQSIFKQC